VLVDFIVIRRMAPLFVFFQVYTNWANHYLGKNNGRSRLISNLQTDFTDGVLLARLIEAVGWYISFYHPNFYHMSS
jgi:Calponin homology (CH) domain